MSAELIRKVFETSRASHAAWQVAIVLAEHANGGRYCYPGVPLIAKESRLTSRMVTRALADLRLLGEIYSQQEPGKKTYYLITLGLSAEEIAAKLQDQPFGLPVEQAEQIAAETVARQTQPQEKQKPKRSTPEDIAPRTDFTPEKISPLKTLRDEKSDIKMPVTPEKFSAEPSLNTEPKIQIHSLPGTNAPGGERPEKSNPAESQPPVLPATPPIPAPAIPPFKPGDRVTWHYEQRGDYGFIESFVARVLAVTAKQVRIAVWHTRLACAVEKHVTPAHLEPREKVHDCDPALNAYYENFRAKKNGNGARKEVNHGDLFYAVAEVFRGITERPLLQVTQTVINVNKLRRVVLDNESVPDQPTPEEDARLADGLRKQFPKWYAREFKARYQKEPAPLRDEESINRWYGEYVQARRAYEAKQQARASPASQPKPDCPLCGGTGRVRQIRATPNSAWVILKPGEMEPVRGGEMGIKECECVSRKGVA